MGAETNAWTQLGHLANLEGDYEAAVTAYENAIQIAEQEGEVSRVVTNKAKSSQANASKTPRSVQYHLLVNPRLSAHAMCVVRLTSMRALSHSHTHNHSPDRDAQTDHLQ